MQVVGWESLSLQWDIFYTVGMSHAQFTVRGQDENRC
jgi:hypothetical protein